MFTQNRVMPVNVEKTQQKEAPKTGYAAPRIFAVGTTVELIRGQHHHGWRDFGFGNRH
jgi:hypothetical protein